MKRSPHRDKPYVRLQRSGRLRAGKPMSRSKMKVRRQVKASIGEGASERELRDECDELCRRITELRDHRCFTCGVPRAHYKNIFPGHYITRKILALRWSLANIHAQCNVCNSEHNTNSDIYRRALMREYDEALVLQLELIAQQNPVVQYSDLLTIRDGLKAELARLKI